MEYLMDYASPKTRLEGEKLINEQLQKFDTKTRNAVIDGLERLYRGERDVRF